MAFADKILLNKVDLVSEEEKEEVISRLKASRCIVMPPCDWVCLWKGSTLLFATSTAGASQRQLPDFQPCHFLS